MNIYRVPAMGGYSSGSWDVRMNTIQFYSRWSRVQWMRQTPDNCFPCNVVVSKQRYDMVIMHNGILLSDQKEWSNAICSNMDGPWDCHTKWSKSENEIQMSYDVSYTWKQKKIIVQMHLLIKQKQTHKHRKQTYGYQEGIRGGIN